MIKRLSNFLKLCQRERHVLNAAISTNLLNLNNGTEHLKKDFPSARKNHKCVACIVYHIYVSRISQYHRIGYKVVAIDEFDFAEFEIMRALRRTL